MFCIGLLCFLLLNERQRAEVKRDFKIAERVVIPEFNNCSSSRPVPNVKLLLGFERQRKEFLKIGIPTLSREGPPYIFDTLKSLVNNADESDMSDTSVVVQISDNNETFAKLVLRQIQMELTPQLEKGFIQVTQVVENSYPSVEKLKQNYGDSETRVKWRAKQNIDVSHLMSYCINKSYFYLHLEDDVLAAPNYLKKIRDYISRNQEPWTMLEFSPFGAIAKLFHNSDLVALSSLLKNYFQEQPVDFLFSFHVRMTMQSKRFLRIPTLFRHTGHVSSLSNQTRNHADNFFFDLEPKNRKLRNPEASIWTTLGTFNNFTIDNAYSNDSLGFFWGYSVDDKDYVMVVFKTPQHISHITVKSGIKADTVKDTISTGYLEFSTDAPLLTNGHPECRHYELLSKFQNGSIDLSLKAESGSGLSLVTCLKITLFKMKGKWIFIKDISVN